MNPGVQTGHTGAPPGPAEEKPEEGLILVNPRVPNASSMSASGIVHFSWADRMVTYTQKGRRAEFAHLSL